ncbi:MAG: helix-turn-helix domain-containing protein [Candidatus Pacearchaeota archaeon]
MVKCRVCQKDYEEEELLEGIFEDKIDFICRSCYNIEKVPIIKKPSFDFTPQRGLSVRERVEKLSTKGENQKKEAVYPKINLTKLNIPRKREDSPYLVENYDWILKTARRKRKITQEQLAQFTVVPLQIIKELEEGNPKNFSAEYISKLENFLNISLLKEDARKMFLTKKEDEQSVLKEVSEKVKEEKKKFSIKELFKRLKTSNKELSENKEVPSIKENEE